MRYQHKAIVASFSIHSRGISTIMHDKNVANFHHKYGNTACKTSLREEHGSYAQELTNQIRFWKPCGPSHVIIYRVAQEPRLLFPISSYDPWIYIICVVQRHFPCLYTLGTEKCATIILIHIGLYSWRLVTSLKWFGKKVRNLVLALRPVLNMV